MDVTTRGRLLVATPDLLDPNFARSVVLKLEHSPDGALGVVLNRPTETDIGSLFPAWRDVAAHPDVAFAGGPVAPDSVIALARGDGPDAVDGWVATVDGLGTIDLDKSPDELEVTIDAVRVFAGYAGWVSGQLDDELQAGGWWVFDALPGDAFTASPDTLWSQVVRRQGGRVAWFVHCPPDPSVN